MDAMEIYSNTIKKIKEYCKKRHISILYSDENWLATKSFIKKEMP